jgi:hypothetical protein
MRDVDLAQRLVGVDAEVVVLAVISTWPVARGDRWLPPW